MKINEDQPMGRTKPVYSELAIQHGANSYPLPFGRDSKAGRGVEALQWEEAGASSVP